MGLLGGCRWNFLRRAFKDRCTNGSSYQTTEGIKYDTENQTHHNLNGTHTKLLLLFEFLTHLFRRFRTGKILHPFEHLLQ